MKQHNNRKFDKLSYKRNDLRAKEAMIKFLKEKNFTNIKAKEDYFFDIFAKNKKDKKYFFEVEIKNQWGDYWNPSWKEVRIPERKRRLINKWKQEYPNYNLIFVVFNRFCSKAWFITATIVNNSYVGTIQNSKRTGSPHLKEPFFHIPINKAKLININNE
tara:strand:+ start:223 stop:702 length:480 start_codon:yes stop_codon:yes gene_type:complete